MLTDMISTPRFRIPSIFSRVRRGVMLAATAV
jgi:hypothetical protein